MKSTRTPAILLLACALFFTRPVRAETDLSGQRIYRVMCVADPTNSLTWQYPLWEKLFSAGYLVEFIGSKTNSSRIGAFKHEPWADKTIENFRKQSPDIVLLDLAAHDSAASRRTLIPHSAMLIRNISHPSLPARSPHPLT